MGAAGLVRYLLDRGADPTSNEFPDEPPDYPTAKDYASTDLNLADAGSSELVNLWEINLLIDNAILQHELLSGRNIVDVFQSTTQDGFCVSRTKVAIVLSFCWNRCEISLLAPFFESKIVLENLQTGVNVSGVSSVIDHLQGILQTVNATVPAELAAAEVVVVPDGPSVLVGPMADENSRILLVTETQSGKITKIKLDRFEIDSTQVRHTNVCPGRDDFS